MTKKPLTIEALKAKIAEKQNALESVDNLKYNANSPLRLNQYVILDIPVVRNKRDLVNAAGMLVNMKNQHRLGEKALKVKERTMFVISGFTAEEWIEDLGTRLLVLDYMEQVEQIKVWNKTLDALMSETEKRAAGLEALAAELE